MARAAIAGVARDLAAAPMRELESYSGAIVVEVAGTHIFRIARNARMAASFARERRTLEALAGRLSTPAPKVDFFGESPGLIGYRKLPGGMATPELIAAAGADGRGNLHHGIARFLAELHGQDRERFGHLGRFRYDAAAGAQWLDANRNRLLGLDPGGRIEAYAAESFAAVDRLARETAATVPCHGDLHVRNVLCDPASGHLTGVIDFANAMIGDHHFDFRMLRRFGEDAMAAIIRDYEAATGRRVDLDRVLVLERVWLSQLIARPPANPRLAAWALDVVRAELNFG